MFAIIYHNAPPQMANALIIETESGQKHNVCLLASRNTRTEAINILDTYREIYTTVKVIEVSHIEIDRVMIPTANVAVLDSFVELEQAIVAFKAAIGFRNQASVLMRIHMMIVDAIVKLQKELKREYPFLRLKIKDE